MKLPYQFNDKTDPEDAKWSYSAETLIQDYVRNDKRDYYSKSRGIESQIVTLSAAFGGLADLLLSKGLISPQDFLEAIGAHYDYEVRESRFD